MPENDARKSRFLAIWIFVGVLFLYAASIGPAWKFCNSGAAPDWFPQAYMTFYAPLAKFLEWTGTADAFERYGDWWYAPPRLPPGSRSHGTIPPPSPHP